jgi:hypothetical protein
MKIPIIACIAIQPCVHGSFLNMHYILVIIPSTYYGPLMAVNIIRAYISYSSPSSLKQRGPEPNQPLNDLVCCYNTACAKDHIIVSEIQKRNKL